MLLPVESNHLVEMIDSVAHIVHVFLVDTRTTLPVISIPTLYLTSPQIR
jgi:hypothetical protein